VTVEIDPVRSLDSVTLTEPGNVIAVRGLSFVAGKLPLKVG
jgi:hypothetical protein